MKQLLFIFLLACVAWPWSKGAYQDGGMDKGAYQSLDGGEPEPPAPSCDSNLTHPADSIHVWSDAIAAACSLICDSGRVVFQWAAGSDSVVIGSDSTEGLTATVYVRDTTTALDPSTDYVVRFLFHADTGDGSDTIPWKQFTTRDSSDTSGWWLYEAPWAACAITVATTSGGDVSPEGVQPDTCGDTLAIEATPDENYIFDRWERSTNIGILDSTDATTSVWKIDSTNGTVTAYFINTAWAACTITVVAGDNGSVNPEGAQADTCGDTLDIEATASDGYVFDRWERDENIGILDSTDATTSVWKTDSTNGTVTAYFTNAPWAACTLTIATTTGGTVDPTGAQADTCGDTLAIEAIPNENFIFDRWERDANIGILDSSDATTSVWKIDSTNGTVTAYFIDVTPDDTEIVVLDSAYSVDSTDFSVILSVSHGSEKDIWVFVATDTASPGDPVDTLVCTVSEYDTLNITGLTAETEYWVKAMSNFDTTLWWNVITDEGPALIVTIDSISPIKGKRLSLDTIYVTNLPDSSATTEIRFNAVEFNTPQQWSDGMVIDTILSWMPRGYYTPRLFDGNDTLAVSGTRYRVLVPEIVKDGSN